MSYSGKSTFVGCSKWQPGDDGAHRSIQIDRDIDEEQFIKMFKNGGKLTEDTTKTVQGLCSLIIHPRSRKEVCRKSIYDPISPYRF